MASGRFFSMAVKAASNSSLLLTLTALMTTKIENLIANEDVMLAMSALVSAVLRAEAAIKYGGDQRQAVFSLARVFENIARKREN
jgi:hypothetical protein